MEVNSQQTRAELEAILRDNAGWRWDSSLAKVKLYLEACEALLSLPLTEFGHGGELARLDPRIIQENMRRAERFYFNRARLSERPRETYADTSGWEERGSE